MARGRMVNKKISNSARVNALPLQAQLLYTWLIPHLDLNGVFFGSAPMVKSLVFPRKTGGEWAEKRIEVWLQTMSEAKDELGIPLIVRYHIGGDQYLWMPGFEDEQVGLRRDKERPEYPDVPSDLRILYGQLTETVRKNVGVREGEGKGREREVEKEVNTTPYSPPKTGGQLKEVTGTTGKTENEETDNPAQRIWTETLAELEPQISKQNYHTWLEKTTGFDYRNGEFVVGVPNTSVAAYLEQNQSSLVEKVLVRRTCQNVRVVFRVPGGDE